MNPPASRFQFLHNLVKTTYPHIRSVLITGREDLIYEHYFQDEWPAESCHNLTSGIKSIVSTLVGIALHKGILNSLDQKLVDFFPEHIHDQADPKIFQVSLRHLLTMSSGFEFSRHAADQAIQSGEWMKFLFNQQIAHQPGAEFTYKPDSLTLSHILMKVSGKTTAEFAREHLFSRLGITDFDWDEVNWSSFYPRDLAKLARLYLNNGRRKGQQILSTDYISEATTQQMMGNFPEHLPYGYLWWVIDDLEMPAFQASGFGGQYIFIIPGLNAAIIITSNIDRPHQENRDLIEEKIIPALKNSL